MAYVRPPGCPGPMTSSPAQTAPTDADRLAKLFEAYRAQEEDVQAALAHVERLTRELEGRGHDVTQRERDLQSKDHEIAALKDVVAQKDREIARLKALEEDAKAIAAYKDRITALEAAYAQEKERLAKLFLLYEEATKRE